MRSDKYVRCSRFTLPTCSVCDLPAECAEPWATYWVDQGTGDVLCERCIHWAHASVTYA